jgi:hypothetical protein
MAPLAMTITLFRECSALSLLLDQCTLGVELHLHFDALETAIFTVSDQSFADKIVIAFIAETEIVVQVHAAFDDLTAAIAFYVEDVVSFCGFGEPAAAEDVFEETHSNLPVIALVFLLFYPSLPYITPFYREEREGRQVSNTFLCVLGELCGSNLSFVR